MITTTILTTLATLSAGLIYTHADGGFNMPSSDAIDVAPGLDETLERDAWHSHGSRDVRERGMRAPAPLLADRHPRGDWQTR